METATDSGAIDSESTDSAVGDSTSDSGEAGSCTGDSMQSCGKCGTQTRTCTDGTWSAWSTCSGEKECIPGDVAAGGACPGALEKSTKKCNATCTYDADVCALPKGWTKIADPPASFVGRTSAASVWTGGELIVYGGGTSETSPGLKDAAMYRLRKNDWVTLPNPTVGSQARKDTFGIWTGINMLVWGGRDGGTFLSDGIMYRSDVSSWQLMAASPLTARSPANVVWIPTLNKMFVFGGTNSTGCLSDSALYDATGDSWSKTTTTTLSCRSGASAVWTGTEVLIWGGRTSVGASLSDGALYNPSTNSWRAIPSSPLSARAIAVASLTPTGVLLFGGVDLAPATPVMFSDYANLSLSPSLSWGTKATAPSTILPPRFLAQTWSTSTALYVWSGINASDFDPTGGVFDFASSTWSSLPTTGAPVSREAAVNVTAGNCGLVWSGYGKPGGGVVELLTDGAMYCP